MSDIVIRSFEPPDQSQAEELILTGLAEHWRFRDPSKNLDLRDIATSYGNGTFLVACAGSRVVGTGALKPRNASTVEVLRMSVAPDMRRRGIGSMILRSLLHHAKRARCEHVILETTETWAEVIRFYEQHGFRITHHWAGDVYLALDLTDR